MSVNVKRIREVFEDNDEVASWCDTSTYVGAETYTHLVGLYETALAAADEIDLLCAENERLRDCLLGIGLPGNRIIYCRDGHEQAVLLARAALKENS